MRSDRGAWGSAFFFVVFSVLPGCFSRDTSHWNEETTLSLNTHRVFAIECAFTLTPTLSLKAEEALECLNTRKGL